MIGFGFLAEAIAFLFVTAACACPTPSSLLCNGYRRLFPRVELRQEFEANHHLSQFQLMSSRRDPQAQNKFV
jgi:hypothetical protein